MIDESAKLDHARLHGRMGISFRSLARHCSLTWDISISYFGLPMMSFPRKSAAALGALLGICCTQVFFILQSPLCLQKLLRTESCTASSTRCPKVNFMLLSHIRCRARRECNILQLQMRTRYNLDHAVHTSNSKMPKMMQIYANNCR